jgi:MFS transporter, ACS family, tartrate transporter
VAADLEASALRKVRVRLIPCLGLLYFSAFIDRVNLSFAAAPMQRDLGLTAQVYGFAAGVFFLGYCLCEVPSNLILHRLGARRWIGRIMLSWAVLAGAMAFVRGPLGFCLLRFLLGVAEAGFFPGIIYYLTYWVPAAERARIVSLFMTAIPISTALGAPLSAAILHLDGRLQLAGWQWLFLLETLPSLLLGILALRQLPDTPAEASWLSAAERAALSARMSAEQVMRVLPYGATVRGALTHPRVLALCLCYAAAMIGLYGIVFWIPQIFVSARVPAAGSMVALPYALAALVMVAWCRHSDRSGERTGHIAVAALVGFAGLVGGSLARDSAVLTVLAISIGVSGTLAILPVFWTLPASRLRGAAAAGAIALINAVGNIGGFAGPYAVGWLKQLTGSFAAGLVLTACGVLACGLIALMIGHNRSAESRDAVNEPLSHEA